MTGTRVRLRRRMVARGRRRVDGGPVSAFQLGSGSRPGSCEPVGRGRSPRPGGSGLPKAGWVRRGRSLSVCTP